MIFASGQRWTADEPRPPSAGEGRYLAGRAESLSARSWPTCVRRCSAKRLKPGDMLGTEKEIAARFGVSRIVARDALRTLQALGIAEIQNGPGWRSACCARQSAAICGGAGHPARLDGRRRGRGPRCAARGGGLGRGACGGACDSGRSCRVAAAGRRRRGQATTMSPSSPAPAAIFTWPSRRPRTIAWWWCSFSLWSTSPGRHAIRP